MYIGEFEDDKKNGIGIYFFQKGGYYYGNFNKDDRCGLGSLFNYNNNKLYFGHWKNDKYEGRGMEWYLNGS